MDFGTIIAVVMVVATAGASWFQGRKAGLQGALATASDVVGMLATQVGEMRAQLAVKDAQIDQLRTHVATLEGHPETDE